MTDNKNFITLKDAASILGYRHINSIKKLIKKNILKYYQLPNSSKKMVNIKEVLALAVED
jgi:hypothetical protein